MRTAWTALNRAKRIPLNVGRREAAVGVAALLVIACSIGFRDQHRPPSPPGLSGLQESNALEQLIFAPAKQVVENRTSKPQTAPGRQPGERNTSSNLPPRDLHRNNRVWYVSDDVTVRYFIPQPPSQPVPDRNSRARYISEEVTVRHFLPKPAVEPPSTPYGSAPPSVSR